jgi:hypothetical protein
MPSGSQLLSGAIPNRDNVAASLCRAELPIYSKARRLQRLRPIADGASDFMEGVAVVTRQIVGARSHQVERKANAEGGWTDVPGKEKPRSGECGAEGGVQAHS